MMTQLLRNAQIVRHVGFAAITACALAVSTGVQATPVSAVPITDGSLELTASYPDIQTNFLSLDYTASTDEFELTSSFGGSVLFSSSTESVAIADSSFSISGTVSETEAALSLSISGDLGSGLTTLLSGELVSMSNSGLGEMAFLFSDLSGALASEFGDYAGVTYADLFGSTSDLFDFSTSLTTDMTGTTNTYAIAVVEPSMIGLLMSGLALVFARRKSVHQ